MGTGESILGHRPPWVTGYENLLVLWRPTNQISRRPFCTQQLRIHLESSKLIEALRPLIHFYLEDTSASTHDGTTSASLHQTHCAQSGERAILASNVQPLSGYRLNDDQ